MSVIKLSQNVSLYRCIAGRLSVTADLHRVLFLCTGNSARSILAEAILTKIGGDRFAGYSAGSQPKGDVHPDALELLQRLHHRIEGLRSKSWDEFAGADAPHIDFIITVCGNAAHEICPVWPNKRSSAHWGLPDPAAVEDPDARRRAFASTYRALEHAIGDFVSLPLRQLDPSMLQKELDAIGESINEA